MGWFCLTTVNTDAVADASRLLAFCMMSGVRHFLIIDNLLLLLSVIPTQV
jgi:hypothetical protein